MMTMITKRFAYILFALIAIATLGAMPASAAMVQVKVKLDSAILLMGKQTTLHIEMSQDKNAKGYFMNEKADTLVEKVEVAARPKPDTVDLGNNRIQINRSLIIQSFDSGMYVLPPLKYVIGRDTFLSNSVTLKVIPVKVDKLKTIHDFKPVEQPPFHFFDWLPSFITDYWWIYVLLLILIAGGLFVYYKWIKKGTLPLMSKPKPIPPYEEAIMRLEQLKQQQLWQTGQEKAYFTELTDILRRYIDRRFQINAVEMTSSQIIAILKKNAETRAVNDQLEQILEVADFVKFAKMRPMPEDNEAAYQHALTFVNETKPVEVVAPTDAANPALVEKQGARATTKVKEDGKK